MVICFKISSEANKALRDLLATGGFKDQSEALNAALVNYQIIHSQVSSGGAQSFSLSRRQKSCSSPAVADDQALSILDSFDSQVLPQSAIEPILAKPEGGDLTYPGRWLFGQMNRFLPVKVTCRGLATLLKNNPAGAEFEAARESILEAAVEFGAFLAESDQRSGAKGDEKLSLCFPDKRKGNEKSKLRFSNQFIGSIDSQGQMFGMPTSLCLMRPRKNGARLHLALTEPGLHFALLNNPVIDQKSTASGKYSSEETEFLVDHIFRYVPEEAAAYKLLLAAIRQGSNTPDALDGFLRSRRGSQPEISPAYLSTQRSGVISRMVDIGLIQRKKDGTRVSYLLTKAAESL